MTGFLDFFCGVMHLVCKIFILVSCCMALFGLFSPIVEVFYRLIKAVEERKK